MLSARLNLHSNNSDVPQVTQTSSGFNSTIPYQINGTTVIDTSRNLTSINQITSQGLTRTNNRISSSQDYPVGHYSSGDTVFEIDPTWSNAELSSFFNHSTSSVAWTADSTAPAGYAITITGGISVGGVYGSGFPYIPVGTDDIFYMECYIRNVGSNQTHYMGSNEYNESFGSLGGNPGSYGYWVMSNTNVGSSWTKVSAYITGFGNTVGQFETGTKYWTPLALFNYGAGTGTRACVISGWKVVRVNHSGNRTFEGRVITKASGNGAIGFEVDTDVGASITLGNDGTYGTTGGGRYTTLGFGGTGNGTNRIFALNTASDGIYICSATSRSIHFRANGGGANTFTMTAAGDFQAVNTTVINSSREFSGTKLSLTSGGAQYIRATAANGTLNLGSGNTATALRIETNGTISAVTTLNTQSINATNLQATGGINLRRNLGASTGISFYTDTYHNWQIYMASAGATSCGANGNLTAPTGLAGLHLGRCAHGWKVYPRMVGSGKQVQVAVVVQQLQQKCLCKQPQETCR